MKVIFYYYAGGGGGLSNMILLLRAMARSHPEDAFEIVTSPAGPFDSLRDVRNIRVRRLSVTGHQEIDRFLVSIFHLSRLAREIKADILWSMNLGPYLRPGLPSVLSVHNPHQVYPWALSRYHPGTRWHVAVLRWFFRRSLQCADAVVVQTSTMAEYVRGIRRSPQRICVAPKAVERDIDVRPEPLPPDLRSSLEDGLGRDAFTCLYVATWSPHKNHVTLIRAFAELARKNIRARIVLTVPLKAILAMEWPEAPTLIDKGYILPISWVAKPHLRALYAACDASLMPSVLESLSSAHLEAMQWGLPQITADLAYARDLCGPAALYARAEDAHAWVQAIERLMHDKHLRRQLVDAGRARVARYPASWDDASETVHRFLQAVQRGVTDSGSN